jgi:hypothetical protein
VYKKLSIIARTPGKTKFKSKSALTLTHPSNAGPDKILKTKANKTKAP